MNYFNLKHFLILLFTLIILGSRRLRQWSSKFDRYMLPVFSAETITHREAEFINDRLPKVPVSVPMAAAILVLIIALVWWVTR